MKKFVPIITFIAFATVVLMEPAFAQGFAPGGSNGSGFVSQIVTMAITYVIIPLVDAAILYHAATMLMGGHRMQGIAEAVVGLAILALHTQIAGMVAI